MVCIDLKLNMKRNVSFLLLIYRIHPSCIFLAFHIQCVLIVSVFFSSTVQQQEQDPTNLYISNLPLSIDEQELENMLKHFGQVISTRILRDSSGHSRGVGFARSGPCFPGMLQHKHTAYVRQILKLLHMRCKSQSDSSSILNPFYLKGPSQKTSATL